MAAFAKIAPICGFLVSRVWVHRVKRFVWFFGADVLLYELVPSALIRVPLGKVLG